MSPEEFIGKWRAVTVSEIAASQSHFNDLCDLIGEPKPLEADPTGERFAFEKHVFKLDGRPGFADVWKKDRFAWEYKRVNRFKSLAAAYGQLKEYADALENPPLLIVCDIAEIQIHTNFTSTVKTVHVIKLGELNDFKKRELLKHAFTNPELLRPATTRAQATEEAARQVASVATRLRAAGHGPERIAHFLNKLVFCMFAEDIDLLPNYLFRELLEQARERPADFPGIAANLFKAMQEPRGFFGTQSIPWFNGGLFADAEVLLLSHQQIIDLHKVALLDWSAIEPPIFGTLFERGLDPEKRTQLASLLGEQRGGGVGIHYTDPDKIMKIVEPVILRPLRREWEEAKAKVAAEQAKKAEAAGLSARTRHDGNARQIYADFLDRLRRYRVLDPACGSGNFLYVALLRLKDFEMEVLRDADALGLQRMTPEVGPEAVMGIEINPYAAELARLVVWIGELQWQLRTGANFRREPILRQLNQIECRDALIDDGGGEAAWPKANAIIGNPPFVGTKRLIAVLKEDYVRDLRRVYDGRVPQEADLVMFWFAKGSQAIASNEDAGVGLVATNSIRGGANRRLLSKIIDLAPIFDAWSDEPWVQEGAAVRVSLVCYGKRAQTERYLDGHRVPEIFADLTPAKVQWSVDLTKASRLIENRDVGFMGDTKGGAFDISGELARRWLIASDNPSGRPNSDVLRPWLNGMDVTRRTSDTWIIDFGTIPKSQASSYMLPFQHLVQFVQPFRAGNRREAYRERWWTHMEARSGMRAKMAPIRRQISTPTITKHRLFVWLDTRVLPDHQLIVIVHDDDTTFGILHSRFHEQWSLRLGTSLEDRPRYTPTTTFETFPFPEGLTPNIPAADYADDPRATAIAEAAKALDAAREAWLNPPELVKRVPEVVPGYPDRILPVGPKAAEELKSRTLTKLYNERPDWLKHLHATLDAAVARAYGWPEDISDDDALARLFALNQARAAAGR